jgi:hypothetical protein
MAGGADADATATGALELAAVDAEGDADALHAVASMTTKAPIARILCGAVPERFIAVGLLLIEISFDLHLCLVWLGVGVDLVVAGPPVAGRLRASASRRLTPGG